jgi:nitrous oxide reductase accessory protein NosL
MKTTAFRAIYLVVIFSLLIAACSEEQLDKTKPPALPHDHNQHQHSDADLLNINPEAKKPEIVLSVTADAVAGWNIHIAVSNFSFTPEKVNQAMSEQPEGHAHIYVDGYKIARLYSQWYHLKPLTPGPHTIRVGLNSNDHSNLSYNGTLLEATTNIIQH